MSYAAQDGLIGYPQLTPYNLPDSTSRMLPGTILTAADPYWGGGEFIYVKANGTVTQFALLALNPTIASGQVVMNATEVTNTTLMGRPLAVAMVPASSGQFFWACIGGVVPVKSNATVAADTTFSIAAAGQAGALAAGKQVVNARVAVPATQTVAKTGCTANSGSTALRIPNADGWFVGAYLSGTGIAALTVITDIDPSGTLATLSVATTAAVNGTVTATYNNATIFYNIAHINRPFAQGAIT
jgi:hypothetical protein